MEKGFDYYGLNEVMGVPDPDRTEQLINALIKRIKMETETYIFANTPASGFWLIKPEVSNTFSLSGDLHILPWLDENTTFTYEYNLRGDEFSVQAKFLPILDIADVYVYEDGSRVIRYSNIELKFAFGKTDLKDQAFMRKAWNEIKTILRHELEHAYEELMRNTMFPVKYEGSDDDPSIKGSAFMIGYDDIAQKNIKISFEIDDEKK